MNLKSIRNSHHKQLIFSHININSVRYKWYNITDILHDDLVDFVSISETKLDDSFPMNQFAYDGFKLYRKDRTAFGGGLMTYVRADIPQRQLPEYECQGKHVESIVIEITIRKERWVIITVYNPNKKHVKELQAYLEEVYEQLISCCSEIICIGDLNIDLLRADNDLQSTADLYGATNLISGPTCFKNPAGTLLDPVLVNNKRRYACSFNLPCSFSDFHNIVGCVTKMHVPNQKPRMIMYRSYKKFNLEAFQKDIVNIPESYLSMFDDPSDTYWAYEKMFLEVLNEHAPMKCRTVKKPQLPYMNSEIRKEMFKRNSLRNKYYKCRTDAKWEAFKKQRNLVTSLLRKSFGKYITSKCEEDKNGKTFWKIMRPFMTDKNLQSSNIINLKEGEDIISNPVEVSEIFNDFFVNIAAGIGTPDEIPYTAKSDIDIDTPSIELCVHRHKGHPSVVDIISQMMSNNMDDFRFHEITIATVAKKLSLLNIHKSTGPDAIPGKLLKQVSQEISPILCNIFNACIKGNVFPHDMKKANVTPIYKKLDSLCKGNYRPINTLSIISKIFEMLIAEQLTGHFTPVFNKFVTAYRRGYGCENALLKMTEEWRNSLDEQMYVGTALMDLSKAFDCLPHALFIAKLRAYKVSEDAACLLASYLSNRKQRVKLGTTRSTWKQTVKGVPQGSGLGPLLFNIFINDIFMVIKHCQLLNYADDNTLYVCHADSNYVLYALQTDMKSAVKWFNDNNMEANPSKFQSMFLKPKRLLDPFPKEINIGNMCIAREDEVKLLGVFLDSSLSFDNHVKKICMKAVRQLNSLRRLGTHLDVSSRLLIYKTFLLANFNFCPMVWHFCSKGNMLKLEKVNERALRFIYNDLSSSYETLLRKVQMPSLNVQRLHFILTEIYKTFNKTNPLFMHDLIRRKNIKYELRRNYILDVPNVNTKAFGLHSFRYLGTHIWNLLPNDLKSAQNVTQFKKMLKTWSGPMCSCDMCDVLNMFT